MEMPVAVQGGVAGNEGDHSQYWLSHGLWSQEECTPMIHRAKKRAREKRLDVLQEE